MLTVTSVLSDSLDQDIQKVPLAKMCAMRHGCTSVSLTTITQMKNAHFLHMVPVEMQTVKGISR